MPSQVKVHVLNLGLGSLRLSACSPVLLRLGREGPGLVRDIDRIDVFQDPSLPCTGIMDTGHYISTDDATDTITNAKRRDAYSAVLAVNLPLPSRQESKTETRDTIPSYNTHPGYSPKTQLPTPTAHPPLLPPTSTTSGRWMCVLPDVTTAS